MLNKTNLTAFLIFSILIGCKDSIQTDKKPNIVIIFLDDAGYSDFKPFGETDYQTPSISKLAEESMQFTHFFVPQAVCSASRASLVTGCYPGRTRIFGALGPEGKGLSSKFPTFGEALKKQGYTTAIFGKWHLGNDPKTRPEARGFDESLGLMVSNDMWKYHPNTRYFDSYPLPLWKNGKIEIDTITPNHQKHLTRWYTENAVDFIKKNKENPFLLYVPHSMPHVPIYCHPEFEGKSGKGLYADVMLEIDWSVGQITKTLKENGLEENTIVIFTSDNGPWTVYGNHSGKTPFREAKGTSFGGGIRNFLVVKYPKVIKAKTISNAPFSSVDIFPSLLYLAGAKDPENNIDGKVKKELTYGKESGITHEYYPISKGKQLQAIISGDGQWKLILPHSYRTLDYVGNDGASGKYNKEKIGFSLFNLDEDPNESKNVISEFPEIRSQLEKFAIIHNERFYNE